jgi:hypothetical protein
MKLSRNREIEIIVQYLISQVEDSATRNKGVLALRIVENGKLIELYSKELAELNKTTK